VWGVVHRRRCPSPGRTSASTTGTSGPGLPEDWREAFAANEWIELDTRPRADSTSPQWLVTDAGRAVMRQWLPDHLRG
jgi:hypothetical protein